MSRPKIFEKCVCEFILTCISCPKQALWKSEIRKKKSKTQCLMLEKIVNSVFQIVLPKPCILFHSKQIKTFRLVLRFTSSGIFAQ